ncbi:MAG TPA: TadE/TadG family type IV pilus assembly protein [Anaerolineae bacterium]|nr:TadE/TadG family type IV pilus assembly protein [Anaerolineae bacterium]
MRLLRRGQSLVEFALILPVLLLVFFAIIDGAFMVQGLLTVNHAARQAARFATAYQPPQGMCLETYRGRPTPGGYPYCSGNNESDAAYYTRRVALIKWVARAEARGLRIFIDCDTDACFEQDEPGIFGTRVRGFMDFDAPEPEWNQPGLPGLTVQVQVIHNVPLVMFNMFGVEPYLRVVGTSQMINEGIQAGQGNAPPPTAGAAPPPEPPKDPPPTVVPPTVDPNYTPEPTPLPGEVVVTLNFESAVNILPDQREHPVIAHVTEGGKDVNNIPVIFTLNNGSFDLSGSEAFQTKAVNTDATGRARVSIYTNEPTVATVTAWADGNQNGVREANELDTATKTWQVNGPYLIVSDHYPKPNDFIAALVKDHPPATPYSLWWCTNPAEPLTVPLDRQLATGIVVDTGTWSAEVTDIEVPASAAGTYHLETHNAGGACGAADLVARSAVITIKSVPPDLVITNVKVVGPPENKRAPGVVMTVTVTIKNTQPVTATGGPFDIDVYPHLPEGETPGLLDLGADKQWETLGPGETKVVTAFVEVAQIGVNRLWAQVDTSNYVAELDETNNVYGPVTFEVCPGSDNFDAGAKSFWAKQRLGGASGSYAITSYGALLISNRSGELFKLSKDSSFYYFYQNHTGDFDARLRLIRQPNQSAYSKIGLHVRAGLGLRDRYVMNMVTNSYSPAASQAAASGVRVGTEGATTVPYWARIVRVGTTYSFYRSYAVEPTESDWVALGSVEDATTMNLIGVAHANYNTSTSSNGIVDDFILCPAVFDTPSAAPPDNPPGLVQCEEVLDVRSFEGNRDTVFSYWRAGEAGAFRHTSEERYMGNFSMRLHASLGSYPCTESNLDPYLYQDVEIPATDIYSITTLVVTGNYFVAGSILQCSSGTPDAMDKLLLELRRPDDSKIVPGIEILSGGAAAGVWKSIPITLSSSINLMEYAGETVRIYWDGYHNGNFDGTFFYVDDVSAQVCTRWPIPDPIPGTVSFGGSITSEAAGTGLRVPLPGATVWAYTQAGDTFQTASIHDGTYHFYNLTQPGTYVVYAEAVVEGELRTAVANVTLAANDRNYNVNMFLQ